MLLVVPVTSKAVEPNEPNQPKLVTFQGVPWGCSIEQIKEKMGGDPNIVLDKSVVYQPIKISGLNSGAMFIIKHKQFLRGRYIFIEEHSNDNLFLDDFNTIDKALKNKYGEPTRHEVFWRNDLYKDDYSHWGFAMSIGHLVWFSTWEIKDVKIIHMAAGDKYHISHFLEYSEKTMSQLEKTFDEEDNNSKL